MLGLCKRGAGIDNGYPLLASSPYSSLVNGLSIKCPCQADRTSVAVVGAVQALVSLLQISLLRHANLVSADENQYGTSHEK